MRSERAALCTKTVTNDNWAALDQGSPTDFAEGETNGASLEPPSLYDAQRFKRWGREGGECPVS
mgnify:CR=1 FL=1